MSAPQSLHCLLGLSDIIPKKTPLRERRLLESYVATHTIRELTELLKIKQSEFSRLNNALSREASMPDTELLREMILDLISTGDYTLTGVGQYTGFHEDTIQDIVSRLNTNPSLMLFYKLAELHLFARKDLYENLKRNIVLSIFQKNFAADTSTEATTSNL